MMTEQMDLLMVSQQFYELMLINLTPLNNFMTELTVILLMV